MMRNQFSWFQTDVSLVLFCSKRVVRYQTVSKHANWYAKKCISDRRVAGALLRHSQHYIWDRNPLRSTPFPDGLGD